MLKSCPECQQSVSSKAPACPRCGHPLAFRRGQPYEAIGATLIIGGLFSLFLNIGAGLCAVGILVGFPVFLIGRFLDTFAVRS